MNDGAPARSVARVEHQVIAVTGAHMGNICTRFHYSSSYLDREIDESVDEININIIFICDCVGESDLLVTLASRCAALNMDNACISSCRYLPDDGGQVCYKDC